MGEAVIKIDKTSIVNIYSF